MRDKAQIAKEIDDITEKISIVTDKIAEKAAELETFKRRNAAIVERSIGNKKRQPKSLEIQRRNIFTVTQQIEEFEFAKARLEEKLSESVEKLRFAEIFQQVSIYKEGEEIYFKRVDEINSSLARIASNIESLQGKIEQLKSTDCPIHLLAAILKDLNGRVSVHHFLNGEIKPPDPVADEDLVSSRIQKYKSIGNSVPPVGDLNGSGNEYFNQLYYVSIQASQLRHLKRG